MEVVHLPTGAVFPAYPYSDLRDLLQSITWIAGMARRPALIFCTQPATPPLAR